MRKLLKTLAILTCLAIIPYAYAEDSGTDKELNALTADASARIGELGADKTPLPDNVGTLYDLMREIDNELAEYKQRTDRISRELASAVDVAETRRKTMDLLGKITALDCPSASADTVQTYAATLRELLSSIAHIAIEQKLGNGSSPIRQGGGMVGIKTTCDGLVSYATDETRQAAILEAFDKLETEQTADARRREQSFNQVEKLTRLLQDRKWAIQTAISAKSSQQQLSGGLWKVISVISLFSIATILVVKLFDVRLQTEWIATGQVIQFVTVMILLSVLMALGLSGVLEQNTLGTLLGSVAGHVLAQGVGRAAAHATRKQTEQADES